jgi:outer membrane receptor protein involved in Fe transport
MGTIAGEVLDGATGQPVAAAVVSAGGIRTVAGDTGKFQMELAPGTYRLVLQAPKYLETAVEDVVVRAGQSTPLTTLLALSSNVTTVEVKASVAPVMATAESMLQERKLAAAVSDSVSAEEIRQSVASDAAGVLQKVTGVSVVDSGFVFVRGLGERYSSTMLDNAVIPTTEPEKRVVPLDLFPARLIESIRVVKSYTPDLPGEFSGGVVQLSTVDFPKEKVLKFSATTGYNTVTTGKRLLSFRGGSADAFGFDRGSRSLPSLIPSDKRLIQGSYTAAELQQFGQSFSNNWQPTANYSMRPEQSYSVVGGNTFGRIGIVGALTFSNKPQNQFETQRYIRQGSTGPLIFTNYENFNSGNESARLGGVLNVAFKLTDNHKLVFRNTLTRDTDKEAREFTGYDGSNDGTLFSQRLRWVERGLLSNSVEGTHMFPSAGNSQIRWQFTTSSSSRNEPDMREVIRGQLDDGRFIYLGLSSSGQRFFSDLNDRIYEPQAEFSKPLYKGPLTGMFTVGFRGTFRNRDFQARRFRFLPRQTSTLNLFAPSNELFSASNIRPNGFQILEFTRATDRYDATMDIFAGYAMADFNIGPRWRFVTGVRIEDAAINVNTLDPLVPNAQAQTASLVNRDPMPSATVIYSLTPRMNLRGGYAQTVSRPDFRELSPFDFNNVYGGFVTQGNPNLMRATIKNSDLRWEWFPGGNQLIAASVFLKDFKDPIEVTILPSNDLRQTYVNAKGARNVGFEFETRTPMSRFGRRLREFGVQANFTFVDSTIDIRQSDAVLLTSASRPLLGQSRFIFNVITEWKRPKWRSDAHFDVNYVGRRISDVGTFGVPDIYQEAITSLDFSYQYHVDETGKYALKFTAENLADNHYHWTQGPFTQRSFRLGRTFSAGLTVSVF